MCECEAALHVANILPKTLATMVNFYVSTPITMGQRKPKKKKIPRKRLLHLPNPYRLIMQNENALLYLFKK